eukprot:s1582_g8.t1
MFFSSAWHDLGVAHPGTDGITLVLSCFESSPLMDLHSAKQQEHLLSRLQHVVDVAPVTVQVPIATLPVPATREGPQAAQVRRSEKAEFSLLVKQVTGRSKWQEFRDRQRDFWHEPFTGAGLGYLGCLGCLGCLGGKCRGKHPLSFLLLGAQLYTYRSIPSFETDGPSTVSREFLLWMMQSLWSCTVHRGAGRTQSTVSSDQLRSSQGTGRSLPETKACIHLLEEIWGNSVSYYMYKASTKERLLENL